MNAQEQRADELVTIAQRIFEGAPTHELRAFRNALIVHWATRRGRVAEQYAAWRATPDGERAFQFMLERARLEWRQGAARIRVAGLREDAAEIGYSFSNTFTPFLARELVTVDARLDQLIERLACKADEGAVPHHV